uniref:Uncharacterized protein n=1 Tax=Panagrolaimus sp. ES5 TaxID=591445 RepID=A0AC34FDY6_9BILA
MASFVRCSTPKERRREGASYVTSFNLSNLTKTFIENGMADFGQLRLNSTFISEYKQTSKYNYDAALEPVEASLANLSIYINAAQDLATNEELDMQIVPQVITVIQTMSEDVQNLSSDLMERHQACLANLQHLGLVPKSINNAILDS